MGRKIKKEKFRYLGKFHLNRTIKEISNKLVDYFEEYQIVPIKNPKPNDVRAFKIWVRGPKGKTFSNKELDK